MKKRILFALFLTVILLAMTVLPAIAADPTITITFSAKVVAATNSESTWAAGPLGVNDNVFFSADNSQDDNYSEITNTGNVAVDVDIEGTDAEGGAYDLTLAAAPGDQQYSIYAISGNGTGTYSTEVKKSSFNNLVTNLSAGSNWFWSMNMTMPTAFNASDDGSSKNATVTLGVTEH